MVFQYQNQPKTAIQHDEDSQKSGRGKPDGEQGNSFMDLGSDLEWLYHQVLTKRFIGVRLDSRF